MLWTLAIVVVLGNLLWCVVRRCLPKRVLTERDAVVVTGCDSGFGLSIVKALLRQTGCTVVAGCVTKEGIQRLKPLGSRVLAVQMDVTKDEDVARVFNDLEAGGRSLAGVVNNAGIGVYGWCEALEFKRYEATVQVNLLGIIRVTKAALPQLRKSKGRLVTMGSLAGRAASAFGSAYTPTKAAVASFQDAVRQEVYRFGVYCSLVEPGFFATGMLHRSAELGKASCSATPGGGEDPAIVAAYGSFAEKMKASEASVVVGEKLNGGEEGVSWVTNSVLDALTSWSPRTRYLCGFDANLLGRLCYVIPDFAMDLAQTYLI